MMQTPQPDPSHVPDAESPPSATRTLRWVRLILAGYWIALATGTHWPNFSADVAEAAPASSPLWALQVDKPMHFCAFGLLALLLIRARPWVGRLGARRSMALGGLIALVYAPIDEYTQTWAIERSASISDLVANSLGVLTVYLFMAWRKRAEPGAGEGSGDRAGGGTRRRPWFGVLGVMVLGLVLSLGRDALGWVLADGLLERAQWGMLFGIGLVSCLLLVRLGGEATGSRRAGLVLAIGWVALSAPLFEIARGLMGIAVSPSLLMAQEVGLLAGLAVLSLRELRRAWASPPTVHDPPMHSEPAA